MADLVLATRRPRRYLVISLFCAGLYNVVMNAGNALGINYLAMLCVSFAVMGPTAYALHSYYTFERSVAPVRFLRFVKGQLGGFFLNVSLMALLVSGLAMGVPLATLVVTVLMFAWNYLTARWAILLHREPVQPSA